MAVTSGFFNSLNGDRTYNADQMSEYFRGILRDGVVQNYGGGLQVVAGSGMNVNVRTGRAYIDSKWMEADAVEVLSISTAHATLGRYTAIVVHLDASARQMTLEAIDGTPASSPAKPVITSTSTDKYLVLAYVLVPAGSTAITAQNVTDNRANTAECGYVSGLVDQVDTSTLFTQWQAAYAQYYDDQTAAFNAWFASLQQTLGINTYLKEYRTRRSLNGSSLTIPLDNTAIAADYTYASTDVIHVYINGLLAREVADYTLDRAGSPPTITPVPTKAGTEIQIVIYKAEFGLS